MALTTSASFEISYIEAATYPRNLVDPDIYATTLASYLDRLNETEENLFIDDITKIHIPFRDLVLSDQDPNTLNFKKRNLFSHADLNDWIGDKSTIDPLTHIRAGSLVTKPDPVTRFIFPYASDHRSQLNLTKAMLQQILSYHQVMPSFLEFLFLFGLSVRPVDLRYSGFREQTSLTTLTTGLNLPALGRSGQHYELCYNLKTVNQKNPKEWVTRHAAIYHKFDVKTGKAVWIIVQGSLDLKNRLEPLTGKQCREQNRHFTTVDERFGSSLAVHLLVAHWAAEFWRWYLRDLEDAIDTITKDARYEDREKSDNITTFTSRDLQNIQVYSEKANEAVMVIESNIEVLVAICAYYKELLQNPELPFAGKAREHVSRLTRQINNIVHDFKTQSARARILVKEVQSRRDLILQHRQDQSTRSVTVLTAATYGITKIAQKDAIAIRIITIVALFYLPATFVSSFFSTDVVKYQDPNSVPPNSTSSFSELAMMRWVQVTLPLTVMTMAFSYAGYLWAKSKRNDTFDIEPA